MDLTDLTLQVLCKFEIQK